MIRGLRAVVALGITLFLSAVMSGSALASKPQVDESASDPVTIQSIGPADGLFTCDWIAQHPTEATAFRVSCRPDMVNPGADLERAAELERLIDSGAVTLSDGSACIPSSCAGLLGAGVYGSTSYEYSNTWTFSFSSAGQNFYWYIKKSDDSIQVSGGPTVNGQTVNVASNVYRLQIYNAGTVGQRWFIQWDDD